MLVVTANGYETFRFPDNEQLAVGKQTLYGREITYWATTAGTFYSQVPFVIAQDFDPISQMPIKVRIFHDNPPEMT